MNRDKILELAQRADELARHFALASEFAVDRLERFAALIEAEVRGDAEPAAFEFQHEDTGMIDFVDPQQVEWGFQKNNPRWQLIGPVFRHPAPAVVRQLVEAAERAEDSLLACKQTLKNLDFSMSESSEKVFETVCVELNSALAAAKEQGL